MAFLGLAKWLCVSPVRVTFGIGATKRKIQFKMLSGVSLVRAVTGFYTVATKSKICFQMLNRAVVVSDASLLSTHGLFHLNPK